MTNGVRELTATRLVPVHSHSALVTTPSTYSGAQALKTTFAVEAGPYLIHTPSSGLVLGPYPKALFSKGIVKPNQVYGIADDSFVRPEIKRWLSDYCKDAYLGWGKETEGEGLTKCWTGKSARL